LHRFTKTLAATAIFIQPLLACSSDTPPPTQGWYTQGDFAPVERVELVVRNPLDRARTNSPVTIRRDQLGALPDVHEMSITLVDPKGESRPQPSNEAFQRQGGHLSRQETNGRWIPYQLDDLDHDGLWDELFFMADFAAGEDKVFYLYIGPQDYGWEAHRTHANIASYVRHNVPFWESEEIGWKLWFQADIDVFGKRAPVLMSQRMYMENLDGYGVSYIDPAFGSDIMQVNDSFGGGGIGVFEDADSPDVVSRPRYTPRKPEGTSFNAGPGDDTRYAFTVLTNGPVRSMVRARTLNWDSGNGFYEAEQVYTAYAGESYSTSRVTFTRFEPRNADTVFGAGIRKHVGEDHHYLGNGIVISGAPEAIRNLDDEGLRENSLVVDYVGTAMVIPETYSPEYVFVPEYSENHAFRIEPTGDRRFEYLIAAGWSEGTVNRTPEAFETYVLRVAEEFNAPVTFVSANLERDTARAGPVTWHLDNLESIGGHPVTVAGDPEVIETPAGKAILFDGVDDGIFLDTHPLAGMDAFTVEVVFRPDRDGAAEQRFFHMQEDGSDARVMFETRLVENTQWFLDTFILSGEQGVVLYAEDDLHDLDAWQHAAIVVDGETMRHYVNGELELTEPLSYSPQADGKTSLGVRLNRVHWYKGAIRTARFTPGVLSPEAFLTADD